MGVVSAPGSADSADSWDDNIPEPQAAASSPTFGKHYTARNKPPLAGTREFDAFEDVCNSLQAGYIRPTVARRRAKEPAKLYHPSLFATVFGQPPQPNPIPTENLQGRQRGLVDERLCAEQEYREHRVVHNSPVRAFPAPAKRPPRHPAGERQPCPYVDCKLLYDHAHVDRFTHKCKKGLFCDQRGDPAHNARFRHVDLEDPEDALWEQQGWAAENKRSVSCAPIINASRLYQSMPALSCIPRGGYRPAGGTKSMTEMRELRAKRDDNVMLVVHGIHPVWTDQEFFVFVRDLCNFPLVDATVVPSDSEYKNAGMGLVTCYNYVEAEICKNLLHGRDISSDFNPNVALLRVEYSVPIENPKRDTYAGKPHQAIYGIKDADPAVPRYNRLLGTCGAYWQDAEAIVQRMRSEGHTPNLYTYTALLFCYRNGRPPQPRKAMLTLERMNREKVDITTTACNIVVDAWCRAGNMQRAEDFVKKMEEGIKMKSHAFETLEKKKELFALPNEETYIILAEGWQRLGVMEEVANRQRGYKMDEPPPASRTHPREPAISGVLGISKPAPSILTAAARRRAGFCPNHMGYFQQQKMEENFGLFEPNKWRSRV